MLNIKTRISKLFPLNRFWVLKFSLIIFCCSIPSPFLEKRAKNVAKAMMFTPPSCISNNIMNCPFKEKSIAVSKIVKPVTVLALTDVNKAFLSPILFPVLEISGIIRSSVPTIIKLEKDIINNAGGDIGFLFKLESFFKIELKELKKK